MDSVLVRSSALRVLFIVLLMLVATVGSAYAAPAPALPSDTSVEGGC